MSYIVELKAAPQRQLKKLEKPIRNRILKKLEALAIDPRPLGVKKLSGEEETYRVRVGDYRIIYQIFDRILRVSVIQIGHRREIYKK
ncbi:RelE/StbE replicon stabilization toxin [Geitlerinema sp. FC II]|nr:type II toxin-antitoxin system RelE/ParE family toxin [Geitlerinema sp. CS-897]PPT09412.1 RelE/StbE replicon stabilization toxin [Geitlerinema sp. FC II]